MNENEESKEKETKEEETWEPPKIIDRGQVEARLFSDEPDPWDGF